MTAVWIASAVLAWLVLALLVAVILSVLRQTAELRARVAELEELLEAGVGPPVDAADAIGERMPEATVPILAPRDLDPPRSTLPVAAPDGPPTLLVFHSPTCASCGGLEEALAAGAAEGLGVRLVSALALEPDAAAEHRRAHPLPGVATIASGDLPYVLQPDGTPALHALDADGVLRAVERPRGLDDLRRAARDLVRAARRRDAQADLDILRDAGVRGHEELAGIPPATSRRPLDRD